MASAMDSTMIISTVIMTAASRTSVRYEPADGFGCCALMSSPSLAATVDGLVHTQDRCHAEAPGIQDFIRASD
jgi:hypothetical protein